MSPSQAFSPRAIRRKKEQQSVALVITLAMMVIVSLLVVSFVTAMRLDRSATASYSQSIKAEMLARGALQLVVAQLQQEMSKDALPDGTYPGEPLYTNVMWVKTTGGGAPVTTNIAPQRVGTNAAMTNLVKISTNAAPFTGTLTSGKTLNRPSLAGAVALAASGAPIPRCL